MRRVYKRSAPQTAQRAQDQAKRNGEGATVSRALSLNPSMHDPRDLRGTGLDALTPLEAKSRDGHAVALRSVGDVTAETGKAVMPDASGTEEAWETWQVTDAEREEHDRLHNARIEILEIGARPRRITRGLAAWRSKHSIEQATGALPNTTEERTADKAALLSLFMDALKQSHYERGDRVGHFEAIAAEAERQLAKRHDYHPRLKLAAIIAAF